MIIVEWKDSNIGTLLKYSCCHIQCILHKIKCCEITLSLISLEIPHILQQVNSLHPFCAVFFHLSCLAHSGHLITSSTRIHFSSYCSLSHFVKSLTSSFNSQSNIFSAIPVLVLSTRSSTCNKSIFLFQGKTRDCIPQTS